MIWANFFFFFGPCDVFTAAAEDDDPDF